MKTTEPNVATYYVRSSVLGGQVIEDVDGSGNKLSGYVYVGGKVVAEQASNGFVGFVHQDPSGVSIRKTHSVYSNIYSWTELDALGAEVETEDPYLNNPDYSGRGDSGPLYPGHGNVTAPSTGCTADGVYMPCDMVYRALQAGAAVQCPNNDCLPHRINVNGRDMLSGPYQAPRMITTMEKPTTQRSLTWFGVLMCTSGMVAHSYQFVVEARFLQRVASLGLWAPAFPLLPQIFFVGSFVICGIGLLLRRMSGLILSLLGLLGVLLGYLGWFQSTRGALIVISKYSRPIRPHPLGLINAKWWDIVILAMAIVLFFWEATTFINALRRSRRARQ